MHYKRDRETLSKTTSSFCENSTATVIVGGQAATGPECSRQARHRRPTSPGGLGKLRYIKNKSGRGSSVYTLLFASLFFFISGAIVPLFAELVYRQKFFYSTGSPLNKALLAAVSGIVLFLAINRMESVTKFLKKRKDFMVLTAIAALSAIWSPYPGLTIQKTIVLLTALIFGTLFVVYLSYSQILFAVMLAGGAIAGLSVLAVLFAPEIAIMEGPLSGMWRGIMYHKNALGHISAFLFIPSLMLLRKQAMQKIVAVFFMMLSITLIIGSASATAMILIAQSSLLYIGLTRWPRLTVAMYVFMLIMLGWVLVLLVVSHGGALPEVLEKALRSFGKDLTLTGRTFAWSALIPIVQEHWMFGVGYGTLWHPDRPEIQWLWDDLGWELPNAHNGYLELALNVGVPATVLLVMTWIGTVLRAWWNVAGKPTNKLIFGTLIVCFFFTLNFSVSVAAPGGLTTGFWQFSMFVIGNHLISQVDGRGSPTV